MKFGDLICYRYGNPTTHDGPTMYIGRCWHRARDGGRLIDILGLPEGAIDHKDPAMWQPCTHLEPKSYASSGAVHVYVRGKEVEATAFRMIGTNAIEVNDIRDGDEITVSYDITQS